MERQRGDGAAGAGGAATCGPRAGQGRDAAVGDVLTGAPTFLGDVGLREAAIEGDAPPARLMLETFLKTVYLEKWKLGSVDLLVQLLPTRCPT